MAKRNDLSLTLPHAGVMEIYRETGAQMLSSPATWLFAGLCLLASLYIVITGHTIDLLFSIEPLFFLLFLALIVVPLTYGAPPPAWEAPATSSRWRLWVQIILVLVCLALLLIVPSVVRLPGILVTTTTEVILPLGVAVLLAARWRELGFGRGYRSWLIAGISSAPLILVLIVLLALDVITPLNVAGALLTSLLTGPIQEEICFRGVLMTRLSCLLQNGTWAIVLSSLIFGLLHIFANVSAFNHPPLLVALALTIPFQATYGLVLALLLQRTRNLLAGTAVHVSTDTLNFALLPHILGFFH